MFTDVCPGRVKDAMLLPPKITTPCPTLQQYFCYLLAFLSLTFFVQIA
jgi:hypothetical protein